jgi:hypothetical protein
MSVGGSTVKSPEVVPFCAQHDVTRKGKYVIEVKHISNRVWDIMAFLSESRVDGC